MKIGDVAERLSMPASTIRYYERIGLIERQRRVSGRRVFDERALLVLQFVRLAQSAGFSIDETKALLRCHAENPGPSGVWKPFAEEKREAIRQQMAQLQQVDRILTELLTCECSTLAECLRNAAVKRKDPLSSSCGGVSRQAEVP